MHRSTKFTKYLDNFCSKPECTMNDYNTLMTNINLQYSRYYGIPMGLYTSVNPPIGITSNYTKPDLSGLNTCIPLVTTPVDNDPYIKSKTVTIETDVKCLGDLLNIIHTHPYAHDTNYNIDLKALHNIKDEMELLHNMIGMECIKTSVMNQLLYFVQGLGIDNHGNSDYKHTVICGPPGTGKTEIAKLIGKMYSKLGILKNNVFKKVTRSDLIAGYLGQTAIKTEKVVNECLGGVLFIDEAYSLAAPDSHDSFSKECLDTLCEALSNHKNELMVIIAGYENDLNDTFFKVNRGLESRFIWKFQMEPYTADELTQIFTKKVVDNDWHIQVDDTVLRKWFSQNYKQFVHYGRDMEQLFTHVKIYHGGRIYGKDVELRKKITLDDLTHAFENFEKNKSTKDIPSYLQHLYT